jgi:limonene-1,2-epoxide hydrolase
MMELQRNNRDDGALPRLNPDWVLELWSKTYNTQGKPDWSHIFPYYAEEIIFQDPIQKVEGKQSFIDMCNRLTRRCKELKMKISSVAAGERVILMEWEMIMIFRNTPSTSLFGGTRLMLSDDGQIIHQRDYYDLWGDIFANVPVMKKAYPGFMKWIFG